MKAGVLCLHEVACIRALGVHGVHCCMEMCNVPVGGMNTFSLHRWLCSPFSRRFLWDNLPATLLSFLCVVPQKSAS